MASGTVRKHAKLEAGQSSRHGHSSSSHGHSSHKSSSKGDKKHGKGKDSGNSKDDEPKYNYEWVWSCHNCGIQGGMSTWTEVCPECNHPRCDDCHMEWVKIRDIR